MRVVIIGTGPAGLTALRVAAEKNCEVWLIDQGPHDSPDYSPRNLSLKGESETTGGFGGTTRIWAGQLIPLSDRELLSGEYASLFSHEEYNDEIFRILRWFKVGRVKYLFSSFMVKFFAQYESPRFSLITKFLDLETLFSREILANSNRLLTQEVKALEVDGASLRGLKFHNGEKFKIFPEDVVVLAAGTMGNARILLETFPQETTFEIGKNLSDHPCGYIGSLKPKHKYGLFRKPVIKSFFGDYIKIKYEVLTSNSSGCFEIHPNKSSMEMSKPFSVIGESGLIGFLYELIVRLINLIFSHIAIIPWVISESADIWLQFEQSNSLESSIDFQENMFIYNWKLNYKDMKNYNELVTSIAKQLSSGSKKITIKEILNEKDLYVWAQQANHPSGTLSNRSFIKKFGIMKQYEQILITGGSIFPRASWVNPTLTIMATTSLGMKEILKDLKLSLD